MQSISRVETVQCRVLSCQEVGHDLKRLLGGPFAPRALQNVVEGIVKRQAKQGPFPTPLSGMVEVPVCVLEVKIDSQTCEVCCHFCLGCCR